MKTFTNDDSHFNWLVKAYFSDPRRWIRLSQGSVLLRQGHYNNRLYLVRKGRLIGYMIDEDGNRVEILQAAENAFVGIYSFFSRTFTSVATVEAEVDCELAYIDSHQQIIPKNGECSFEQQFMPIVIADLMRRQQELQQLSVERANTLKKLLDQQRMASLGQLAAGIAHELNNAVAVISRNTGWMVEQMNLLCSDPVMFPIFEIGLNKGRFFSSREVRLRKKELIQNHGLPLRQAELVAQTGLPDDLIFSDDGKLQYVPEELYRYWELGATFHDLLVAADQTSHVMRSIKTLGAKHNERYAGMDVNESIRNALTLLRHRLRDVQVNLRLSPLPSICGNMGELVQLWMNLIQNASEALKSSDKPDGRILIQSKKQKNWIVVSVEDNGPGIPKEILPQIFQPNVTTKVDGLSFGLGLGLTIVQRIVSEYQGTIDVKSSNKGTKFKVKIPIGGNDE
ncbi:MAG: cyclic nucleotide-binding domain-containing protein [Calditrichaeota bacterium]|nr:cyclic nucleotide-binding domain-containing protein [Calditrichota bacterium]